MYPIPGGPPSRREPRGRPLKYKFLYGGAPGRSNDGYRGLLSTSFRTYDYNFPCLVAGQGRVASSPTLLTHGNRISQRIAVLPQGVDRNVEVWQAKERRQECLADACQCYRK